MKRVTQIICSGFFYLLWGSLVPGQEPGTKQWPPFSEVYEIVRTNLTGLRETDLNRAAVEGFLKELDQRVSIISPNSRASQTAATSLLSDTNAFEGAFGLLRVARVESGLEKQFLAALNRLQTTNQLKGLIIDLRFASGQDYRTAAAVADLFIANEKTLLSWDNTTLRSAAKTNAITLPLTVLMNRQTRGAAEAVADILRHHGLAVLIGGTTAGQAQLYRDFPLRNGQQLRIATNPILSGRGQPIGGQGLQPDIEIQVNAEEEKLYFTNAYATVSKPKSALGFSAAGENEAGNRMNATNRAARPRNEAELIRMQREGQIFDDNPPFTNPRAREPAKPTIQDPALARALDLLKGLALVQRMERR